MMEFIKGEIKIILPFYITDGFWFHLKADDLVINYLHDNGLLPSVFFRGDLIELLKQTKFKNIITLSNIMPSWNVELSRRAHFQLKVNYENIKMMTSDDLIELLDNECGVWLQHIQDCFKNPNGSVMTLLDIVQAASNSDLDKSQGQGFLMSNLPSFCNMYALLSFLHKEVISKHDDYDIEVISKSLSDTYSKFIDNTLSKGWVSATDSGAEHHVQMKIAFNGLNDYCVAENKLFAKLSQNSKPVQMQFENQVLSKIISQERASSNIGEIKTKLNKNCLHNNNLIVNVICVSNEMDSTILKTVFGFSQINSDDLLNNLMVDLHSSMLEKPLNKSNSSKNMIDLDCNEYSSIAISNETSLLMLLQTQELLLINTTSVNNEVKSTLDSLLELHKQTGENQYRVLFTSTNPKNKLGFEYNLKALGVNKLRTGSLKAVKNLIDKKLK